MKIKIGDIIRISNVYKICILDEFDGEIVIVKEEQSGSPVIKKLSLNKLEYKKLIRTKILEMLSYDYKGN